MIKSIKIHIPNLIFLLITHLSLIQSSAMDVPENSLEKFNLYTTKGIYQFHQVDFQNLNQNFIETENRTVILFTGMILISFLQLVSPF